MTVGIDKVGGPGEVPRLDVGGGEGNLHTVGVHGSGVTHLDNTGTANTLGINRTNQVKVVTGVPVCHNIDAVVQEAGLNANVELVLLLVRKFIVGNVYQCQTGFLHVGERAVRRIGLHYYGRVGYRGGTAVTGKGIGRLHAQVRQGGVGAFHPFFLMDVPGTGNVPGGQPAGRPRLAQAVGTLITDGTVDRVPAFIGIGGVAKESDATVMAVGKTKILLTTFLQFLEIIVVEGRQLTHGILHAGAGEICTVTVYTVDFHTGKQVHDMVHGKGIAVVGRRTDIPSVEFVGGPAEETAVRKDGERKGERVVGIRVQIRVRIPDGSRRHFPVGRCLVRFLRNVVFL